MKDDNWDFDTDQVNPLALIDYTHSDAATTGYRLQSNAFLEISPIKGLKFRTAGDGNIIILIIAVMFLFMNLLQKVQILRRCNSETEL